MKQTAVEWYTDALKQWDLCYMESNGKISKDVYESIKISLQEKALEMEKCPPQRRASVPLFFNGDIEEYGYLYTAEGEWLVKRAASQVERDPIPLAYVLSGTVKL